MKRIYIEDVLSFRANSILDQYQTRTVFTHQYQTQLYRGRALLQGRQYLYINIKRSYIEDVQYFASISNVVIQRTCSPLGQAVFCINIKRSYIEDVLSFRADSIYTSISNVVIQRTCSPLGQTVFCINIKRSYIEDVLSFRAVFIRQYQTQSYRGRALLQGRQYFASISNVVIQRTCSPLGQTQLYRGRALLLLSFIINIKRSYIEDVLSFRADSIYTSISNVVIQRTCSPLGQTVFIHQYQTQLYRGRALLQGRQYFASISNVVIQRTCSPLGQTVYIHQ